MALFRSVFRFLQASIVVVLCFASLALAENKAPVPFSDDDTIDELREKIRMNGFNFEVGYTWVFDLPLVERKKMRRGGP